MPRFLDTNVLLYSVAEEREDRAKREAAVQLLQSTDLALSAQVMAEFYAQTTRRSRTHRLDSAEATEFLQASS